MGPETVLNPALQDLEIDPQISNKELEWSTNQRCATIPVGIVIRLDKY